MIVQRDAVAPLDPTRVLSSQLVNLLEILLVLVIDYVDNGAERKPDSQTANELRELSKSAVKQWGAELPALQGAIDTALQGRSKAAQLALLGQELKEKFADFRANERFTIKEIEMLKALGAYLRTDSEPALRFIKKNAGLVNNPYVSKRLAPKIGNQNESKDSLRDLVYQMVGRDDTALTLEEAKQAKELYPALYKQYLAYRRQHSQVWKDAMTSFVRKSGQRMVPYQELLEFLHANGIDHVLPLGFTGQVDDLGVLYTNQGQKIDGVPSATMFPSVIMNPKFGKPGGGDFVFQAVRANGGPGPYFYTVDFKKAAAREKFARVSELSSKMESIRRKWVMLLKKFNPEHAPTVAAIVLELLFEFSARIGSGGNKAGGTSTYGIATLRVKHVSVDSGGNLVLRYMGKDAVRTVHKLLKSDPIHRVMIAAIMQLMQDKIPKDPLFTVTKPNGRLVALPPAAVNNLFRQLGAPEGVTVHKIRTYHGTKLFQDLVKEMEDKGIRPKTEQKAMELYKKMGMQVGKLLNHVRTTNTGTKVTGSTALLNYIDFDIQIALFRSWGFRPPKFLENKFMDKD